MLNRQDTPCVELFKDIFTSEGHCCSFNYIGNESNKTFFHTLHYGQNSGLKLLMRQEFNGKSMAGVIVKVHGPLDFPDGEHHVRKVLSMGRYVNMAIQSVKRKCSESVKVGKAVFLLMSV